jgi:hypothetical protein
VGRVEQIKKTRNVEPVEDLEHSLWFFPQ